MAGNFDHVTSGQPFEVRASTWNDILDAAAAVKRGKRNDGGGPLDGLLLPSLKCLVKYDESSTSSLDVFSVLAYSSASIDPTADEAARLNAAKLPAFVGATPVSRSAPFMITVQPIQGQSWGVAVTAGLVPAYVDVLSLTHHRARPSPGTTEELVSCSANGVPVVWPTTFTETGPQWCIINLTDPAGCCPEPATPTLPVTIPLDCTIPSGSAPGSGQEPMCCTVFKRCDGSVYSTCSGALLTAQEVAEFAAGCGAAFTIQTEICDPIRCDDVPVWYCDDLNEPCSRLETAGDLCVHLMNGTRAYRDVQSAYATAGGSSAGWSFDYTQLDDDGNVTFQMRGQLQWCTVNGVPGLYFVGSIRSTNDDPSNAPTYDCGCLVVFQSCGSITSDGSQEITTGPVGTACEFTSETLEITTPCGTIELAISSGACTSPPPPPPPNTVCGVSPCSGGMPGRWQVANVSTSNLPAFDALDYVSGTVYTQTIQDVTASLFYNGTDWKLYYTGGGATLAVYTLAGGSWNCCASNTMTRTYADAGLVSSSTVTVSTQQSCTCPHPGATYDCISNVCVDPGDGSGAYASLAACIAAPCNTGLDATKWYCTTLMNCGTSLTCLQGVAASAAIVCSGPYETEADCQAGCGGSGGGGGGNNDGDVNCCQRLISKTASMSVTGGTYAGTHTGTWELGGEENRCRAMFVLSSTAFAVIQLTQALDPQERWRLYVYTATTANNYAGTLVTCNDPTAIITIPAIALGATQDIVISTTL